MPRWGLRRFVGLCLAFTLYGRAMAAPDRAPRVAAGAEQDARAGRFELVTYNVAGLPEGISRSRPLANLPLIGKLLNRYDVALVQEDFAYPLELRRLLALAHGSAPFVRGDRLHLGDGLSQFSRLPFSQFQRVEWRRCHGLVDSFFDCLTPKGFTTARQALGRGAFARVVNLHMDAGWSREDHAARAGQVSQLVSALQKFPRKDALIVAGDTNILARESELLTPLLHDLGLEDACAELSCPEPWRIDRVFYRSSVELQLDAREWRIAREFVDDAGRPLSDHLPVVVAFDWKRLAPPEPQAQTRR